jgi:hypothetical protein
MKRYRNSIVLLVVFVITLGTFYVKVGFSASNLPEFNIKNEFGKEREAASIVLYGNYYKGSSGGNVSITQKGSNYESQKSFLDQLEPLNFRQENLIKLRKEERQFMRSKKDPTGFYIEKDFIINAKIDNSFDSNHRVRGMHFKISTLDKKNHETQSFDIPAPLKGSYSYIDITDVQVIGKELKIITRGYLNKDQASLPEIHAYSVNLAKKEVVNHSTVVQGHIEGNGIINDISSANEYDVTEPNTYEVFTKVVKKETPDDVGSPPSIEEISRDFIIYNLKTNQFEKFKLTPEQMKKWNHSPEQINKLNHPTEQFLQGDIVYFINQNIDEIDVLKYNLKEQKVVSEKRISTNSKDINRIFKIRNDKLYIVGTKDTQNSLPSIIVVDLLTGKQIYRGNIVIKNNKKNNTSNLQIYDFYIN